MKLLFILIFTTIGNTCYAQNLELLSSDYKAITDQKYGEYPRNKFDIILPSSETPTGLVIYIHGGGFKKGSKEKLYDNPKDIEYFISHNIAIATISYRYRKETDSLGVKACINDIQRAIQYFRFNATKFNIDKTKIACYGSSAGAGMSLYFALHDDLAIPNNSSILGESTKLTCAAAMSTQATYDVFKWEDYISWLGIFITLKKSSFYNMAANFYGFKNYESFEPYKDIIPKSLDMLAMVDKHDPPIYLENLLEDTFPSKNNVIQHHKNHALVMAEKLKANGVENYVFTADNKEDNSSYPIYKFITEHLK